jgi:hypothetical protein
MLDAGQTMETVQTATLNRLSRVFWDATHFAPVAAWTSDETSVPYRDLTTQKNSTWNLIAVKTSNLVGEMRSFTLSQMLHNEEIRVLYKSPRIFRTGKYRGILWGVHVA